MIQQASTNLTSDRRGLMARVGAAMVGATMVSLLKTRSAAADCAPPTGCYGRPSCGCHGGGCPPGPAGGCCWAYSPPSGCATYVCCDINCADGAPGICRYKICNCC